MTAYLVANPPRRSQFRKGRRAKPTGAILIHSAESLPDVRPPDTGAENVAGFIRNRTDPGSYHRLCDSDTTIELVPFAWEAFHDGTGSNPWSIGISGAFQASQWRTLPLWWRDGCITQMAAAAREAAAWLQSEHGITVPARRITRTQSEQGMAGFISHGERDPGRRTDPGAWFPWDQFLAQFANTQEDIMASIEDLERVIDAKLREHRDWVRAELGSGDEEDSPASKTSLYGKVRANNKTMRDSLAKLIRSPDA